MNTKTAIITIAGRPNVGKSTLTNHLVGEKITIVSNKPQTTRNRICGILCRGNTQYVFVDTPGYHKPRTKLGDYMVNAVKDSIADVDLTLLVVEPIPSVGSQEQALLEELRAKRTPVILVINKIDTLEKEKLLEVIAGDDEYDVVVIDCPPSLYSLGCLNALRAADRLIVPTDSSVYSATGMADLLRQISLIRQNFPHLTISGALITRFRADDVSQDAVDYLRQESPIPIFQTVIRASDAKVAEATWAGQVDQQWSPWCSASRDYRAWVAELMEKEGQTDEQKDLCSM